MLITFNDLYKKIGDELLKNAELYIEEADEDYRKHILLFNEWADIIKKAKEIDIRKFI